MKGRGRGWVGFRNTDRSRLKRANPPPTPPFQGREMLRRSASNACATQHPPDQTSTCRARPPGANRHQHGRPPHSDRDASPLAVAAVRLCHARPCADPDRLDARCRRAGLPDRPLLRHRPGDACGQGADGSCDGRHASREIVRSSQPGPRTPMRVRRRHTCDRRTDACRAFAANAGPGDAGPRARTRYDRPWPRCATAAPNRPTDLRLTPARCLRAVPPRPVSKDIQCQRSPAREPVGSLAQR